MYVKLQGDIVDAADTLTDTLSAMDDLSWEQKIDAASSKNIYQLLCQVRV